MAKKIIRKKVDINELIAIMVYFEWDEEKNEWITIKEDTLTMDPNQNVGDAWGNGKWIVWKKDGYVKGNKIVKIYRLVPRLS